MDGVTTGGAAAPSAPTGSSAPNAAPTAPAQVSAPDKTASPAPAGETAAQQEARILGESDMDALVEIKVNGKTERMPLRKALVELQKGQAGAQRLQQAAERERTLSQKEQQIEQLLERIKTPQGLRDVAKRLGVSPRQLAEQVYRLELEEEKLTPEQRDYRRLKEYEQQTKREREEQERKAREEAEEQETAQQTQVIARKFGKALATAGFPDDPDLRAEAFRRMAFLSKANPEMSYLELGEAVTKAHFDHVRRTLAKLPPEKRAEYWSDEDREAFRKAELARAKGGLPTVPRDGAAQPHHSTAQPRDVDGTFVREAPDPYRTRSTIY